MGDGGDIWVHPCFCRAGPGLRRLVLGRIILRLSILLLDWLRPSATCLGKERRMWTPKDERRDLAITPFVLIVLRGGRISC